jgi:hypothetical protein
MPTASWGLVEVNECLSCSRVSVLYVNSLSNIMEPVWRFTQVAQPLTKWPDVWSVIIGALEGFVVTHGQMMKRLA